MFDIKVNGQYTIESLLNSLSKKDGYLHSIHFLFDAPTKALGSPNTEGTINSVITDMQKHGYEIIDVKIADLGVTGGASTLILYK